MVEKAKYELELITKQCDPYDLDARMMQDSINKDILDLVEMFANQGHSGFSANYVINILTKLLKQSFVTPLTGEDDEWVEVTPGVFQNKREGKIFKQADKFNGKAYYIDGKVFSDNGGKSFYTNCKSFVVVEFPLKELPETEYIIIKEEEK